MKKRLVLIGGGHSHLFVLERFAQARPTDLALVFVTPSRWQMYSGMLPGWMSGEYPLGNCQIDLRSLALRAGAELIEAALSSVDASRQIVRLSDGTEMTYDLLSLSTGSDVDLRWCESRDSSLIAIKPMTAFVSQWQNLAEQARHRGDCALAVIGGGAAGVELSLSASLALGEAAQAVHISLIVGDAGLLPAHHAAARRKMAQHLSAAGVHLVQGRAVSVSKGVRLAAGGTVRADWTIAAAGAVPPAWVASSGLERDAAGFIAVDRYHRSRSHARVFAAGDLCARGDDIERRSGVDAVRAGPILAHNLLAVLDQQPLHAVRPRRHVLHLITCGRRHALLIYGGVSVAGSWIWTWKDRIDRRFVRRFSG